MVLECREGRSDLLANYLVRQKKKSRRYVHFDSDHSLLKYLYSVLKDEIWPCDIEKNANFNIIYFVP